MSNSRLLFIQLIIFIGAVAAIPHVLLIPFSTTKKIAFDNRQSVLVHKRLADVVLLGNSMLKTRVTSKIFGQAYGRKSLALPMGGSGSTRWYLSLKNSVIPASDKTRQVIIFFRDHEIIDPMFRTTNQHREAVEKMKIGSEPELIQIQKKSQNWREAAWNWIYENSWVVRVHRDLRNAFTLTSIRDSFPHPERAHLRFLTKSRFEIENLRGDLNFEPEVLGRPPTGDLRIAIEKSLLPKMLELANAHNIKLLLYRISRRPGVEEVPLDYLEALRAYCSEHGISYVEEKELMGAIPLDWYADGDHISSNRRKQYTVLFGQKLKAKFP